MESKTPLPTYVLAPLPDRPGRKPWRKVHLDFHNSKHIARVGHEFDPAEFIATLKQAHVDSIVVFAKDMHGYCYYPSPTGPVHPGLSRDLLGEQVRACKEAGIEVYAYYCTLWDHHLAEAHPEWLSVKRDGTTYMPPEGEPPGWTALCASNNDLVKLIETHVTEILTGYDVDGIWFDMPIPRDGECFCPNCRASIKDPEDTEAQRHYQQKLHTGFLKRLYTVANKIKPGVQVDFNNQPCYGLEKRFEWMDTIDIEALPTAEWGYDFFPTVVRYVRTFPRAAYGMTGRFLKGWGDFGGLKTRYQLTTEAFGILAQGARCDIGDQMPPSGRLDPAVYEAIGAAYEEVERLESCLEGAQAVAELAVVCTGHPLDSLATPNNCGWAKLLGELNIQFDVVPYVGNWERYPFVIFVDYSRDDDKRVDGYMADGGKTVWARIEPDDYEGQPDYLVMPGEGSPFEFAVYGTVMATPPGGTVLAERGLAAFPRSGERYTSHSYSPFDNNTKWTAAFSLSRSASIFINLGRLYAETGYWIYRELVSRTLDALGLPRLVRTPHVGTIQVTLAQKSDEFLVHVLDTSIGRPSPGHPPYYETAPMRKNVLIYLNLGFPIASAESVRGREDPLVLPNEDGTTTLCLKELDRYDLIRLKGAGQ